MTARTPLLRFALALSLLTAGVFAAPWAWPGVLPVRAGPAGGPEPVVFAAPLGHGVQLTRPFAPPSTAYGPGHRGVDLAGSPGEPVLAAGPGVVRFAGEVAGRPVVSIEHPGGLRTSYEPVRPAVARGRPVERGAVIGFLEPGHPGCSAAACLHWGARRGAEYADPLGLLAGGRVRLLPWD